MVLQKMVPITGQRERLNTPSHSISDWKCVIMLLVILNWVGNSPCVGLRDDWFGYISFEDVSEWSNIYYHSCSRKNYDLYREPRIETKADKLRAINEALSPIKIEDDDVKPSPENVTLHVYNNAGIRKGYSLSYGFQRNKECLHGQDADCVVATEFGRVRALVLNAERFKENENLNFIKDHFKIEEPERFVSILNGGSDFERKFYEAVFLGGRKVTDSRRSSHQINGVAYPLEIYMYFVDETVPSVTLSTVLVVLVEESDRENPLAKSLVSTVEKLYDEERRWLEKNKLMVRRERLYHHMDKTTTFDIYNNEGTYEKNQQVIQSTVDATAIHLPTFAAYLEAFEKMQSLEATLFFIDEDVEKVGLSHSYNSRNVANFENRIRNYYFPYNGPAGDSDPNATPKPNHELHVMAVSAMQWPIRNEKLPETVDDCDTAVEWMMGNDYAGYYEITFKNTSLSTIDWRGKTVVPDEAGNPDHFNDMKEVTVKLCRFLDSVWKLARINDNVELSKSLKYFGTRDEAGEILGGKYDLIHDAVRARHEATAANENIAKYLNLRHASSIGSWNWASSNQVYQIASNIVDLLAQQKKSFDYEKVKIELDGRIKSEVEHLHFPNEKTMREVVHYLKYGDKWDTAPYQRGTIHEQFYSEFLPAQQKRRGFVELGNMEMAKAEIDDEETINPKKIVVDQAFQISWLLPHDGGYYHYEGSSPLPPCFRVETMIVFKKPIKMSKYQIDMLTRLPVSFNRKRDITSTTPIIWDPYFVSDLRSMYSEGQKFEEVKVQVYHQKKNHLFLGHDGVHTNAVEEYDKIKARRNGARSSLIIISGGAEMLMMSLVVAIGLRFVW